MANPGRWRHAVAAALFSVLVVLATVAAAQPAQATPGAKLYAAITAAFPKGAQTNGALVADSRTSKGLAAIMPLSGALAEPTKSADRLVAGGSSVVFTKKSTAGASVAAEIVCYGQSDYPHNSSGTPGSIVGKSRSWCTGGVVARVGVENEMYRYLDGFGYTTVGFGGLEDQIDSAGPVTTYSFDICQGRLAYWYLKGTHTFTAPPGYEPPTLTLQTQTPGVGVNC